MAAKTSKCRDTETETIQIEAQKIKKKKRNKREESVIEPWDKFKQPNMCEIGAVKGKVGWGRYQIFEK